MHVHENRPDLDGNRRRTGRSAALAALCPAAFALTVGLAATEHGAGLSIDSAYYIGAARQLAAGEGLTIPWGSASPTPLGTQLGPLLPILLAGFERLGADALDTVRWMNAGFFAATVGVLAWVSFRATGSALVAAATAMLAATSRLMIAVHAMAWSEPAFLFFGWSTLALIAAFAASNRRPLLIAACAAGVLAILTRYAGAALALTAFLALLLGGGRWRPRLLAAGCAAGIALLPMTPGGPTWLQFARTQLTAEAPVFAADSPAMRQLAHVRRLPEVITGWVWPWPLARWWPGPVGQVAVTVVVAALVALFLVMARRGPAFQGRLSSHDATAQKREDGYRAKLCWAMGLFVIAYPTFLVTAILLFGRTFTFDDRILLPLMGPGLLLVVLSGYEFFRRDSRNKRIAVVALVFLCGATATNVPRAVDYGLWFADSSGFGGQGYHDGKWRSSPTIAAVRQLPAETRMYSNGPDAIYVLTGRRAIWLPDAKLGSYDVGGAATDSAPLSELAEALSDGAVIVYFDRLAWRRYSPSREDLSRRLSVHYSHEMADGTVLTAATGPQRLQSIAARHDPAMD